MIVLKNKKVNEQGFTFIETMIYVFVMTVVLMLVSSLFLNIFNARKQAFASYRVYNDARFMANFFNNRLRNVNLIEDNYLESKYFFYNSADERFDIFLDEGNLFYRQVENSGEDFPEQSSGVSLLLNSQNVRVEDFNLTAISDSQENSHQGIKIDFILSTGAVSDSFAYKSKLFSIYIAWR